MSRLLPIPKTTNLIDTELIQPHSAAQAWNRSDVRAAKNLSLRGQNENDLMRNCHRAAAQALYNQRNAHLASSSTSSEIYVDLHGLHPAEAVSYLASALSERRAASKLERDEEGSRRGILYAIVGTGSHSKQGRDKVRFSVLILEFWGRVLCFAFCRSDWLPFRIVANVSSGLGRQSSTSIPKRMQIRLPRIRSARRRRHRHERQGLREQCGQWCWWHSGDCGG